MERIRAFILLLTLAVLIVLITGFSIAGTPLNQRAVNLDKTRLTHFYQIKGAIETEFQTNGRTSVPSSKSDLKNLLAKSYYNQDILTDPETGREYDYNFLSDYSYSLCTTFSAQSEPESSRAYPGLYSEPDYYGYNLENAPHQKGYDCITLTVPTYMIPTPTPTPWFELYDFLTPSPTPFDELDNSLQKID